MTPEQKEEFYQNGYLVYRGVVPQQKVIRAAQVLYEDLSRMWHESMALGRRLRFDTTSDLSEAQKNWTDVVKTALRTGVHEAILDLVAPQDALCQSIVDALGGPFRELKGAQLATIFPSQPSSRITECGYRADEIPFWGWHGHLDGLWNGSAPVHQRTDRPMNSTELAAWSKENGRNGVRRTFPKYNANVSNFTALLGIPLSDQMLEGCGNLGLLRGAHHIIEQFFQEQRDLGGPLGPDGPGWERVHVEAPNGSGLRHYPDAVRNALADRAVQTNDGQLWPKPDLIKVQPGDAVLALHAIPHCATRNASVSPRLMAYFRLLAGSRPEDQTHVYPDALCDCWKEWSGMQETVQRMRATQSTVN